MGPLPLVNHFIERIGLEDLLRKHVPSDARCAVAHARALGVLLRSLIVEREPIYRQHETVHGFASGMFGIDAQEMERLSDDRLGRALDRLFDADRAALLTEVVVAVAERFGLRFDELHNDSTSISFCGSFRAATGRAIRGRSVPAITYGHSKAHRPDLKQLLFILTMTADGNVPVAFRCTDGNVNDSRTHIETWNTLRTVAGRADFLYRDAGEAAGPEGRLPGGDRIPRWVDLRRGAGGDGTADAEERLRTVFDANRAEPCVLKVIQTAIEGVLVLEPKVFGDERGFFMESFNQQRFNDAIGREVCLVQDNHSRSAKGVLRGLHFQRAPHAQGKLVRVTHGSVFDVAVDVRPGSSTFGKWVGVELSSRNHRQLWIPEELAHGFLVTSDSADFLYKTTDYYAPTPRAACAGMIRRCPSPGRWTAWHRSCPARMPRPRSSLPPESASGSRAARRG